MAITSQGGSVSFSAGFSESMSGTPANTLTDTFSYSAQFGSGTGANNVDLPVYQVAAGTLGTGASATLDFTSFAAKDGSTITTGTKLKALIFENTGTVAIRIGGAAANQLFGVGFLADATSIFDVAGGQVLPIVITAGMTISGTCKNLKILNTSGSVGATYRLHAVESSA